MKRSRTRIASLAVFAAVLVASLAVASSAFATWGNGMGSAFPMTGDNATTPPVPSIMGSSMTTATYSPDAGGYPVPTGYYYLRAELNAGDTLQAEFTPSPGVLNPKTFALAYKTGYRAVESKYNDVSGGCSLSFMAPVYGMYTFYYSTSSIGTFTVAPSKVPAVAFSMAEFSVPSTMKKSKSSTLSIKLRPGYNGPTSPISFVVQRKVSGKWRSYTTLNSTYSVSSTSDFSKFYRHAAFSKTGSFRIKAKFDDAARPATYTKYKYFKVVTK